MSADGQQRLIDIAVSAELVAFGGKIRTIYLVYKVEKEVEATLIFWAQSA